jgi:hypothetical protein
MSTKKNGLKIFRHKLIKLLTKRSRFVDARSYKFFESQIEGKYNPKTGKMTNGVNKKKLDEIYTTLKNVKYLENKVINKKTFPEIYEESKHIAKDYKVVFFGNFTTTYPAIPDKAPKHDSEALVSVNISGKKQLKKMIKQKEDELYDDYYYGNDVDTSKGYAVKKLTNITHEVSSVFKQQVPLTKVPMKNACPLKRDWLRHAEGIDRKSYQDLHGQCVYEQLVDSLKSYWKTVTKEKLFEVFNEFVQKENEKHYLDGAPFEGEFNLKSGVNVEMIRYLCDQKKISMYAFDGKDNCFHKIVHPKSNYKAIAFYCIDQHMYWISDQEEMKSLSSAQKASNHIVVSSMLEAEKKNNSVPREYMECASFDEALQHQNAVVYLPVSEMTDEMHQYIEQTKSLPKVKSQSHKIVQAEISEKNLTIICDPNLSDGYTWRDIKKICDQQDIPFTNQRIGGLIAALRKKFFKPERRVLLEEEKVALCEQQQCICPICTKTYLKSEFQYDHIEPLAIGGSNDLDNFQALCKGCHLQKTQEERDNSDFIKYDEIASTFNKETLAIVKGLASKQWAFIEKTGVEMLEAPQEQHKLDHAKCRRNLVMHSQYDFPMYSVMDYPVVYTGEDIQVGTYFVQTNNYFPFRGNGWYPHPMVEQALEKNIISKDNITHQFLPSFTIDKNYFKNFVEHLVEVGQDAGIDKLIVNSMIGCWAIQQTEIESVRMTLDKYDASRELIRDNVFVSSYNFSDKNGNLVVYEIIERLAINKDDMFLPLYNQIIAMEAMELYNLEQLIIRQGGIPLERNTDAILYAGPKINIADHFYDAEKTVPKYRYDDVTHLQRGDVCKFKREEVFALKDWHWNEYSENSMAHMFDDGTMFYNLFLEKDDFQEMAQTIYDSNQSCQVLGVSGAGKTSLANELIRVIEINGKKCIKLAPTRKAASHIEGQTLHKYYLSLLLSNNYEKKILKNLKNIDYVLVDEISMVKEFFYRFLVLLKRYAPHLKFIIVGDFSQLKPVKDKYHGNYDNSPALHELCEGNRIVLEKCRRSDKALFDLYDGVRRGKDTIDIGQFPINQLTSLNIAYTHKTRRSVNKTCMGHFRKNKEFLFCSQLKSNPKTQNVSIFEGMPIVSYKNDDKLDIYNSERFTVCSIDTAQKTFSIVHKETRLTFKAEQFKFFFYPAYCITIHVSQGCTFDEPYTIYDWSHSNMCCSAKYVALSRATSIHNIQIAK